MSIIASVPEHERRADDRADRYLLALGPGQHRDDRDERLGQRGAHRGEQAAHRALAQVELAARPLDRVGEQDRPADDQDEAREEEQDGHGAVALPVQPPEAPFAMLVGCACVSSPAWG